MSDGDWVAVAQDDNNKWRIEFGSHDRTLQLSASELGEPITSAKIKSLSLVVLRGTLEPTPTSRSLRNDAPKSDVEGRS